MAFLLGFEKNTLILALLIKRERIKVGKNILMKRTLSSSKFAD